MDGDNCFKVNGQIVKISNILVSNDNKNKVMLVYKKIVHAIEFYSYPCTSVTFGTFFVFMIFMKNCMFPCWQKLKANMCCCLINMALLHLRNTVKPFLFYILNLLFICYLQVIRIMYAVIEFAEEDNGDGCSMIEIIPLGWLSEKEEFCYWPPCAYRLKLAKLVKNNVEADSTWMKCTIKRVMYKTDSYLKAREKLRQAEDVSDLQTSDKSDAEMSKKRKKRPVARYADCDSDSDDSPPPLKKRTQSAPAPPPLLRTSSAKSPEELKRQLLEIDQLDDTIEVCNSSFSEVDSTSQNDNTAAIKQILCGMEQMKLQLANVLAVLKTNLKNACNLIKLPSDVSFPLKDMESFENGVLYFGSIGGKDLSTTVRNILVQCMDNQFALHFNMKGKGKKHAFSILQLNKMIQKAVRRNHITASATDADINSVTADWLRFAKDRDGGRKERERKKWEAELHGN
ncbi:uncharacterized protein LOC144745831 [Ciona intestinalis]